MSLRGYMVASACTWSLEKGFSMMNWVELNARTVSSKRTLNTAWYPPAMAEGVYLMAKSMEPPPCPP